MDWKYLITVPRGRVYLLWAVLLPLGFVATHFYQQHAANALWAVISIVGLGYMARVMPLKQASQMRRIYASWLVPIGVGMGVSAVVFYVQTDVAANLIAHLGAFWLGVMAVGFFCNGLVDPPRFWYFLAAAFNAVACAFCFTVQPFTEAQYLIAAAVSAWSMLSLWLFRVDI